MDNDNHDNKNKGLPEDEVIVDVANLLEAKRKFFDELYKGQVLDRDLMISIVDFESDNDFKYQDSDKPPE